jgi:hypothetical protein
MENWKTLDFGLFYFKKHNFFFFETRVTPKDQSSSRGELEVWTGSYDVNFYCDFLTLFLEVWECPTFKGI